MKKLLSLALLLLLSMSNLGQTPPKSWTRMVSQEGQFIVLFPKPPKRTIGRTEFFTMYTFETRLKQETFGVSYFDAPMPVDDPEIREQIYELGKKHHATGQLVETKNISLGKYSGKEYRYRLKTPKGAHYIVKVYLVGQRVYQLDYYTANKASDFTEADKFFASFELANGA